KKKLKKMERINQSHRNNADDLPGAINEGDEFPAKPAPPSGEFDVNTGGSF
ncbi:16540_t:CDS:1, partial [Gigaspora margarita]